MHDSTLSSVDLNLLVVLRALLKERHVTRAAARLGLSQSATSHALSRLRELFDDPLLVRSGGTLQLTPRADRLLPPLERGLSDLRLAIAGDPVFEPRTAKQTFSIGMADYTQALLMGPLLRRLAAEASNVELLVVTFPNLRARVEAGEIDLALDLASDQPARTLLSQPMFDDDFSCVVRKNHPLLKKKLSLAQYLALRHVVVAPSGTTGSIVDTELAERGLARRIAVRVSNFLIAPVLLCQTDLISTMPTRLARQLAKDYPLRLSRPPLPLPKFALTLIWHPRLTKDPAQRWLRDAVLRVGKRL